ncbi:MAG: HEAT repeat domain-containing protein [Planctomycetes bacterium]|nr:HEAT repeat domain-containing protein [Planctomycetota bacterium]
MGQFLFLAFMAVMAAFAIRASQAERKGVRRAWEVAAAELGLQLVKRTSHMGFALTGRLHGFPVSVDMVLRGGKHKKTYTRFSITGTEIFEGLTFHEEGLLTKLGKVFTGEDVQVGSADFDRRALVSGLQAESLAVLDERTRPMLLQFLKQGGKLEGGTLSLERPETIKEPRALAWNVQAVVELARALSIKKQEVPDRLLRNATQDPEPGVRRRNLEALLTGFAGSVEARSACEAALREKNPAIRLLAIQGLGEAGWTAAQELVEAADVPLELRAEALGHLVEVLPNERLLPIVERALASRWEPLVCPALAGFRRLRHPPAFESLEARAREAQHPATVTALAEALGEHYGARAQAALLGLLRHESFAPRVAAARWLGRVGDVGAVEPLLACAQAAPLLGGELRGAARDAVKAIQGRLSGAEGGCLTLAESGGETGALSMVRPAGDLSLVERREPDDAAMGS